jgi:hypothetical protein
MKSPNNVGCAVRTLPNCTALGCVSLKMCDRLKEFNLITVAQEQITDSSSNSGLLNFRITVERLIQLLDLQEEDE